MPKEGIGICGMPSLEDGLYLLILIPYNTTKTRAGYVAIPTPFIERNNLLRTSVSGLQQSIAAYRSDYAKKEQLLIDAYTTALPSHL